MEIWKKIDGFENYSVSNMGRVRNDGSGRVLSLWNKYNGYKMVTLTRNYEKHIFQVHRLVAKAFIPNPDNFPQVNHINEDKTDNRAENLEWCTAKYNTNYGTRTKRVRENQPHSKRCIVDGVEYISVCEASRRLNVPKSSLKMAILRGQTHYKGHTITYR